jgi:hypothetical protein
MPLSFVAPSICTTPTRCRTTIRACATSVPTTTLTVVEPGPRAITDPSGRTRATFESPVVQVGRAPTRMLPFLSVTVAAKCTESPIAEALSIAGRSPTQAAPMLPID